MMCVGSPLVDLVSLKCVLCLSSPIHIFVCARKVGISQCSYVCVRTTLPFEPMKISARPVSVILQHGSFSVVTVGPSPLLHAACQCCRLHLAALHVSTYAAPSEACVRPQSCTS